MGLKNIFKLKRWQPDQTRTPPEKGDWPDHIITLNDRKFGDFIDKYPLSVVDFWAPWCSPCKKIAPWLRQLSKKYKNKVAFGKINVDNYKEIGQQYHIMGILNLVFFSYGEKVTNIVGVQPISDIQKKIDEILAKFDIS